MNSRNTKQKQIILDIIKEDKTHPTIKEIYYKVLKKEPSIGQATVYRMINNLLDENKIIKITTDENHYDYVHSKHHHLICNRCNNIIDISDDDLQNTLNKIQKKHNIQIDSSAYLFKGICNECLEKNI